MLSRDDYLYLNDLHIFSTASSPPMVPNGGTCTNLINIYITACDCKLPATSMFPLPGT